MGVFAWLSRHRLGAGEELNGGWGWPTHGFAVPAEAGPWGMAGPEPVGGGDPYGPSDVTARPPGELDDDAEEEVADGWPTAHALVGRRASAVRASVSELLSECEAFVVGHYAEELRRKARLVPAWAWTNLLAHGSPDALREAGEASVGIGPDHQWLAARSYLAAEILARCARVDDLVRLQVSVLRPLELELAARAPTRRVDSRRWAIEVLGALDEVSHERRRVTDR